MDDVIPESQSRYKDYTILVVDDEIMLREIIKETYEQMGFRVLQAEGGIAAIELIQNNKIDFVLSDVKMPNGDGIQLLKDIRKIENKRPVVVMMTGYSDLTKETAKELGAVELLNKPFQHQDIINIISTHLDLNKN